MYAYNNEDFGPDSMLCRARNISNNDFNTLNTILSATPFFIAPIMSRKKTRNQPNISIRIVLTDIWG